VASVCLYFQVHQPWRLRRYSVFDSDTNYFDSRRNGDLCRGVAQRCYLPANRMMLDLIRQHGGRFRLAYSISGSTLEQFELYAPEVLDSFRELGDTGCVEFLGETDSHSLSFLYSRDEFAEQVRMHQERVRELFGQTPRVFRNTELIFNNDLAHYVEGMGFQGALCEGVDHILEYRSPNFLYRASGTRRLVLLLRNHRLSDDIAYRFSNRSWAEWPLTAEKYARWINQVNGNGYVVNLFMAYESLGERQAAETGIFDFFRGLPDEILKHPDNRFQTPSEVIAACPVSGEYDVPHMISWADSERDLSAWLGNAMQSNALHELYRLERELKAVGGGPDLLRDWRRLQASDHFYYMCTKCFADGEVHKYFNAYESPYDSYINFMNVLDNLRIRINTRRKVSGLQPALV
jgi:alpha-amylase